MTRPLSDDELRDLLRGAYRAPVPIAATRRARPSAGWSVSLVLLGILAGASLRPTHRERAGEQRPRRGTVEAVQDAGSRYAEALAELASAPATSPESAAVAREVVATSLMGVTRSLLSAVDQRPVAIGLYRLASELHETSAPRASTPLREASF
ncbi:MAG: hypothetical protein JF589_05985 [Gemmatimonadetes bacterium]|nr:hypothetical protein [Gemmatimonadota bacterium]